MWGGCGAVAAPHSTSTIAERLGVPEDVVRDVQRRGLLRRLDLDESEIRGRLWRGHASHVAVHVEPRPLAVYAKLGVGSRVELAARLSKPARSDSRR